MNLRTLIRNGRKVLQNQDGDKWVDVPEVMECEEEYHVTIRGEQSLIQPVMDELQVFVMGLKRQHEGKLQIGACGAKEEERAADEPRVLKQIPDCGCGLKPAKKAVLRSFGENSGQ